MIEEKTVDKRMTYLIEIQKKTKETQNRWQGIKKRWKNVNNFLYYREKIVKSVYKIDNKFIISIKNKLRESHDIPLF